MASYIWELGIDWNAVETAGVSYLRGGLVQDGVLKSGTAPVGQDDTITFRIFDVSSSVQEAGRVATIDSFGVLTKAAVKGQSAGNPLSNLQPAITQDTPALESKCFPTENNENVYASWTAQNVSVSVSPSKNGLKNGGNSIWTSVNWLASSSAAISPFAIRR